MQKASDNQIQKTQKGKKIQDYSDGEAFNFFTKVR